MTTRHASYLAMAALAGAQLAGVGAAHATCAFPPTDGCAEGADEFGRVVARGDFNNDGFEDLAIGVPLEDIGGVVDAGAVQVIYGTASGLSAANRQFWSQNSANVEDAAEAGDRFGSALTAGDFNSDNFDDLAIGVPEEDIGSVADAGLVHVIHGSATGLSATFVAGQLWTQDTADVEDDAEPGDLFGDALAAGDFNGDRRSDLAIGVPSEDIGSISGAGAVNLVYGAVGGLNATVVPDQLWSQGPLVDVPDANDSFGFALAADDFNTDGRDDLAIGVPGEDVGSAIDAGAANVVYGSPSGLSATAILPDQLWSQDTSNVEDMAEAGDLFGASLAAGDFNGEGRVDLAIGVEAEDVGTISDGGTVNVIYGSPSGLSATFVPDQIWNQNGVVEDDVEDGDRFGVSLTAGDFNGDGRDDLAVGVPEEDLGSVGFAGAVNVIYGSSSGLSATVISDQLWTQNTPNVEDAAEPSDHLGVSLVAGDFNGDGRDDLAIGVTEDLQDAAGLIVDAGAVNVIHGAVPNGLSATVVPDQIWTQIYIVPPQP